MYAIFVLHTSCVGLILYIIKGDYKPCSRSCAKGFAYKCFSLCNERYIIDYIYRYETIYRYDILFHWPIYMFKRLVPGDFAERHFAERCFAERTFCRKDICAKLTFCRTDSLPKGQLAVNIDVISSKCLGL